MDTGLMQPQPNRTTTTRSPLLEQFRAVLSPTGGSPRTLEEKLAALSEAELGIRLAVWGLQECHFYSRDNFKLNRAAALTEWRQLLSA